MSSQQQPNLAFQGSSFQNNLSSSLTFAPGSLSSSLLFSDKCGRHEEEIATLKRSSRQKEADFLKERAVLQQKVELLKIQLQEAAEREFNLKKMNESVMNALSREKESPLKKQPEVEVNEEHPRVQEIIQTLKQEYQSRLNLEREKNRDTEFSLEKEIQQLNFTVQDLRRSLSIKSQDLDRQAQESSDLQRRHEEFVRYLESKFEKESGERIRQLEIELDTCNADIERQVCLRVNERYSNEQGLNEAIIRYQREQQELLNELKELKCKIDLMEKEAHIQSEKYKKQEDENGSLLQRLKTATSKHKEELENVKKSRDEAQKKVEVYEKSKKLGYVKSASLKPTKKANKENINKQTSIKEEPAALENSDEEKNKLRRQICLMRCQLKKLDIDLRDLKFKSQKEIQSLKEKLSHEKKKRMGLYEERIDKSNQLLQDLLEKDQIIYALNKQVVQMKERLALYGGQVRSHTPKHMQMSMQESMGLHGFANTSMMMDFQNIAQGSTSFSSKMLSPLRSLDFTLNNNGSFSLLPLGKEFQDKARATRNRNNNNPNLKLALPQSPQQIKRARVHSLKVSSNPYHSQTVTSSISNIRMRQPSRDASIAEVNEDLYRDSVESFGGSGRDQDINQLACANIVIPYTQRASPVERRKAVDQFIAYPQEEQKGTMTMREYLLKSQQQQDNELAEALMNRERCGDIYYDSLENQSEDSSEQIDDPYYYNGAMTQRVLPTQSLQGSFSSKLPQEKRPQAKVAPQTKRCKHKNSLKSERSEHLEDEDDCLVNILEHEETHIEVQHTIVNTRQHTSTDNLFKEVNGTFDNFKSKTQVPSALINLKLHSKLANPAPKPMTQKQGMQAKAKTKAAQPSGDCNVMMHSPSSPNLGGMQHKGIIRKDSGDKKRHTMLRNDSCPSPIDEDETVIMLGSGEKLKVKEVSSTRFSKYQNQFKEQRHLFSATMKPPQTTKNSTTQNEHPFRSRTNSLINSVCSEISTKMKFMNDVSSKIPDPAKMPVKQAHTRAPSFTQMRGLMHKN